MPLLTDIHEKYLRFALQKVLPAPSSGTMSYVRCLSQEVLAELAARHDFIIPGWKIYTVGSVSSERAITADRAVDLRENKEGAILLLVDTREAGTGMDGIYSAVQELTEKILFDKAKELLLKAIEQNSKPARSFINTAVQTARKIGTGFSISPWQEFDFYAKCLGADPNSLGTCISSLGLWCFEGIKTEHLQGSRRMVETLLIPHSSTLPIGQRINALLLREDQNRIKQDFEIFLRRNESKSWRETVRDVVEYPEFWLSSLNPGFLKEELKEIFVEPWLGKTGKPLAASGLIKLAGDAPLTFYLPPESNQPGSKNQPKLEVKWKTVPDDLKPGSERYTVAIVTGSGEELVSKECDHTASTTQKCVFNYDDFRELLEDNPNDVWGAKIVIHSENATDPKDKDERENPLWKITADFSIKAGVEGTDSASSSAGKRVRSLVEEAIRHSSEDFVKIAKMPASPDKQNYVGAKIPGISGTGTVYRPPLIKKIEDNWQTNEYAIGRWRMKVRSDGSSATELEFIPLSENHCEPTLWKRLIDENRRMGRNATDRSGFIGMIHYENSTAFDYVNAWGNALNNELSSPELALAHTLEIQSLDGKTEGLIVLPGHPVRVAWHQAYDALAHHAHYKEELQLTKTLAMLRQLDGSYMPSFLPGIEGISGFVFGDTLGFHATAMLRAEEKEPQATLGLLARCFAPSQEVITGAVGQTTAEAIGSEVRKYSEIHPDYSLLKIHALRPGDGMTISRALGYALESQDRQLQDEDAEQNEQFTLKTELKGFRLDLFPGEQKHTFGLGRFLTEVSEQRRTAGTLALAQDRWMTEAKDSEGLSIPRLRWTKRQNWETEEPETAHLSIAYDTFDSTLIPMRALDFNETRPIEAYGLCPSLNRSFSFTPIPTWKVTLALQTDGDKHPAGSGYTDRLMKIQQGLQKLTAVNLGGSRSDTPVIKTEVTAEKAAMIQRLHRLSDWVVTVDRNAGVEYFDAPKAAPEVYDTYVIDCVPERQDLDCVRLVTSTSNVAEVKYLLEDALRDMGLSSSRDNCQFILEKLKALSGRLALRLASQPTSQGELIALAMFYENCRKYGDKVNSYWPSLTKGFVVPIDDVRDLLFPTKSTAIDSTKNMEEEAEPLLRADFIYVTLSKRSELIFRFIEIKYRGNLSTSGSQQLQERIRHQTSTTRRRWHEGYFSDKLKDSEKLLRRKRLARALMFYLDKAHRHEMDDDAYKILRPAVEKLYGLKARVSEDSGEDRGYIYCPDQFGGDQELSYDGHTRIIRFGRQDKDPVYMSPIPSVSTSINSEGTSEKQEVVVDPPITLQNEENEKTDIKAVISVDSIQASKTEAISIFLGESQVTAEPVCWHLDIRSNPHLMIVGQPGTGKTTCLINICKQLTSAGIVPIVFSYHQDIEEKLASKVDSLQLKDLENGLGFNPLQMVSYGTTSWLDNIGMLRDIFASIYPDFGDVQNSTIREAIKQSYTEKGFGSPSFSQEHLEIPEFKRFYEIMLNKQKLPKGIRERLDELSDYGLFTNSGDQSSLLDMQQPTILRLYTIQNAIVQNALASFVLLNLYQNMFLRGTQNRLTHAIVFDEAHRASRLKLIPTMAKECRKYGLSLIVASQAAKDFPASLYEAISNYLVLRVIDADAVTLTKTIINSVDAPRYVNRLKQLENYTGLFVAGGGKPGIIDLEP